MYDVRIELTALGNRPKEPKVAAQTFEFLQFISEKISFGTPVIRCRRLGYTIVLVSFLI